MAISRRDALARLAALTAALPLARLSTVGASDPLTGTIAEYQAGRRRREWGAVKITTRALERCRSAGFKWRCIDVLDADGALNAAGATVLGKTAADDFAYHGNGTSSHTGQVLNPHDKTGTRTPGGSSAGSAVAVATGMVFAALGTDDGGSNRIPAQFTGVVGMKP